MQNSYIPQLQPENLCETLKLCSVRKHENEYFIGKKELNGALTEIPFSAIANSDSYEGKPLVRTYSSGHVFLDETCKKVWLVTTEKDGKIQHQFTGGSPMEDINKEVFYTVDGIIKVHLNKVEDNAIIRTLNRTGARVTESWNEIPLVDWALMEGRDENGTEFWKLVCLMHYVVKKYEGELSHIDGVEFTAGGGWYEIDNLPNTPNVAPNAYIVAKKAQESIQVD